MQVSENTRLKILGMSSVDCNSSVHQALQSVPQVENVVVDEDSDTALVSHGGVSLDALIEAVHQVGYGVYTL